ncbi:hypothetical protein QBC46DRAFT_369554 [Diplogelasinospora grovesii]|uniref:Uncharacterized protein n=1 Tax=Diplogelasinospora grovesii TaxID=303347 RepID=A0AAN6S9T5_9PEZI|nr:hypothetical protein QBC46DRAFT_369554 [Diplogelasinospora grovesii]
MSAGPSSSSTLKPSGAGKGTITPKKLSLKPSPFSSVTSSPASASTAAAAAFVPEEEAAFTARMRDRQARGKDPYRSGTDDDDSDDSDSSSNLIMGRQHTRPGGMAGLGGLGGPKTRLIGNRLGEEREDFTRLEKRHKAMAFLDSPELLMMYAQSTGDSMPGARLHFMKMLCGYDEDDNTPETNNTNNNNNNNNNNNTTSGNNSRGTPSSKGAAPAPPSGPKRDADKRRGGDRASTSTSTSGR